MFLKFSRFHQVVTRVGQPSRRFIASQCSQLTNGVLYEEFRLNSGIEEPTVAIIGGGICGLSAAAELAKKGFKKFKVFEALERAGGRISSIVHDNRVFELGARWVDDGLLSWPLGMACEQGLLKEYEKRKYFSEAQYLTHDGRVVNELIGSQALDAFRSILDQKGSSQVNSCHWKGSSLLSYIQERTKEFIATAPVESQADMSNAMTALTEGFSNECAADLSEVDVGKFSDGRDFVDRISVPSGIVNILQMFWERVDKNVELCSPVEKVEWDPSKISERRCLVHVSGKNPVEAHYVLVTVPLGVLKKGLSFSPCLPNEKCEAIEMLGFGHLNNLYLEYNRPFWDDNLGTIRLSGAGMNSKQRFKDWGSSFSHFEQMPGARNVLVTQLAGLAACQSEHVTEEDIAKQVTRVLRHYTGNSTIPYPSNVIRSKWTNNPFFRGAYSFNRPGYDSKMLRETLGQPVPDVDKATCPPVLFFAGEACSTGHYGTIQGAILSGYEQVRRIIELTMKYNGLPKLVV
ncbi:spermine oxidase-like [Adelges cooleyi]|uniref:spermine oxidase-like n=1 Tax=Adelges cooleyi TaxID=133065 RepID=UPI00217F70FE|nr:spermine oxidase-like [Adelges cooleyi]